MKGIQKSIFSLIFITILLSLSILAKADPPTRVARLGFITGSVSFMPAEGTEWVSALLNRPLTTGDRLWTEAESKVQLQLNLANVCMDDNTSVHIINLNDRIAQFQLAQGTLHIHILGISPNQSFEVDTPNLAFTMQKPGIYRINVSEDGSVTTVSVRDGQGTVYGEKVAYQINKAQSYTFTGPGLSNYQYQPITTVDNFDEWCIAHEYSADPPSDYVSSSVIGYEDLFKYGTWRFVNTYGYVWLPPVDASSNWAPYRYGRWVWVAPWGWTWVGEEPWGFAPYHYGRWAIFNGSWIWVPGPVNLMPIYAPAFVTFIGSGFGLITQIGGVPTSSIVWFPLAPGEVFIPPFFASHRFIVLLNLNNGRVTTVFINQVINNPNVQIFYANLQVNGAITAVPVTVFSQSRPVAAAVVKIPKQQISSAPITTDLKIKPTSTNVAGGAPPTSAKPSDEILARSAIAKTPAPKSTKSSVETTSAQQPVTPMKVTAPVSKVPTPILKVVAPDKVTVPPAPKATPVTEPASSIVTPEPKGNAKQPPVTKPIQNLPKEIIPAVKPKKEPLTTPAETPLEQAPNAVHPVVIPKVKAPPPPPAPPPTHGTGATKPK